MIYFPWKNEQHMLFCMNWFNKPQTKHYHYVFCIKQVIPYPFFLHHGVAVILIFLIEHLNVSFTLITVHPKCNLLMLFTDEHGHLKIYLPKKLLECLPKCSSLPKERHRWNTNEVRNLLRNPFFFQDLISMWRPVWL